MSLHTPTTEEPLKVSSISIAKKMAEQTVKEYFEKPVYYLFYLALPALMVSLFFGVKIPIVLIIIVAGLGIASYPKKIRSLIKKYGGKI